MRWKIILFLILISIDVRSQEIIKIVHPYVLIKGNINIGKLNDEVDVYRKEGGKDIKVSKVQLVKFVDGKTAAKILEEKYKIMIGDFVESKKDEISKNNSLNNINETDDNKKIKTNIQSAAIIEIEPQYIFGAKYHLKAQYNIFVGAKFSFKKPKGEKYNWSQDRADTFYKSDFLGYSRRQCYGINAGYAFTIYDNRLYGYSGIGFLYSVKYRQYYDNTFTTWSKNYYIEDGKISETNLDLIFGTIFLFRPWIAGVGYSTGSSGIVFGIGYILNTSWNF